MVPETRFDQLVFSGGGTRCFWHGGFMHVLRQHIPVHPARVVGVSGGALSGAAFLSHRGEMLLAEMKRAFSSRDRNFDWHQAVDDETHLTHHQRVYRKVVETVVDTHAQTEIADAAPYQILIAHPPAHLPGGPDIAGTLAAAIYEADLHLRSSPHLVWPELTGVDATLVDATRAAAERRLTDLICAAATIPPVFDLPIWDGRPVIDGGIANQAPMPDPDEGRTLVLLTRRYRKLPEVADRLYVWPSDKTPADKIDFTDPGKIQKTWELGEADALESLKTIN